MKTTLRTAVIVACALLTLACGGPPKPRELTELETLRASRDAAAAFARAPRLVTASDQMMRKSRASWGNEELEAARNFAILGLIELRTAVVLVQKDRATQRLRTLDEELLQNQREQTKLQTELTRVQEEIAVLEKLRGERARATAEKQQLTGELVAEKQRHQRALESEQERADAQAAVSAAELSLQAAAAVEAPSYAGPAFRSASAKLAGAKTAFKDEDYEQAEQQATSAKALAEGALATAKPIYDQTMQTAKDKAERESLARDAAAIAGVTVRHERHGDTQRLVLTLGDLFSRRGILIAPSKQPVLTQVAELLKRYPGYAVEVLGHTDSRGQHNKLVAISVARAQAVAAVLSSQGVDSGRMKVNGIGPGSPITPDRSAKGRAVNNRVEVVLLSK